MKKIIASFSLIILFFACYAQKAPELSRGKIYSDSKWTYVNSVFGEDESGYYTFSDMKFRDRIEKYDRQFNKLTTVKLELSNDQFKGREEESTSYYGGKIFVISSSSEKSGLKSFFIETLNTTTLLTNNDVVKLCEFPKSEYAYSAVVFSDDHSKILILRKLNPAATGNKQFGICVYDCKDSKLMYTDNVDFPFADSRTNFIDGFVGNSGNCYLYYHLYNDDIKMSGLLSSYEGHILYISGAGKIRNDIVLSMEGKKPGIARITEKNPDAIFIAGFYSKDTTGRFSGCFSAPIITTEKTTSVRSGELSGINKATNIDHLFALKDGSFVLIGEASNHSHHYSAARDWSMGSPATYNSPVNPITGNHEGNASTIHDMATTSNSYYNGDILVVKFNSGGEAVWNKTIRKNQYFTVPGEYGFAYFMYASYGTLINGDKLHLVFNDHINNARKKDEILSDEFQRKAESALIDVSVNLADGSYTKEILQQSKDNKVLFRPGGSKQISENELVMFGSSDDDHQGMTIKF
jgi:hypothetical protein